MENRNETADKTGVLARAKDELMAMKEDKRLATLIKLIVEETALGKAAKAFRQGYRALIKLEHEQRQDRLAAFIMGIAKDNAEIPDIPPEDFLAVVHKLLQDDEDAKVWRYVRLCVMLARSTLDPDTRLYYLRMTSELTLAQILFARELYLRNGIPLKGYLSTEAAQSDLTSAENGMTLRALSTLSNWGLIKARNVVGALPIYDLTPDMRQLMELLFSPQDLTAEEIGKEAKDTPDVIIVDHIKPVNDLLLTHFRQTLEKKGLSVEVVERNSNFREMKSARCYITNNYYDKHPSHGAVKHYVAMNALRHPDNSTTQIEHPDKQFLVAKDSFTGRGSGKYRGADLLIQELDKLAAYVVGWLLPKKSD
ncbi:TPA: hypothetical protein LTW35_004644 [Enterobacter hormaechei]|nr:hypothetical protein [Enterobacter hormaechei]